MQVIVCRERYGEMHNHFPENLLQLKMMSSGEFSTVSVILVRTVQLQAFISTEKTIKTTNNN